MTEPEPSIPLAAVFEGWDGLQLSIVHAIEPLGEAHLSFRPAAHLRSVGEVAAHIALGRIDWFARIHAPGAAALAKRAAAEPGLAEAIAHEREQVLTWLALSWQMVAATLEQLTVDDLWRTYPHEYYGQTYAVSYQWTVYRIFSHDQHHGGELALLLGMQGLSVPELGDLFGHLTMPPPWKPTG